MDLLRLEQQRRALELNLQQLRGSLKHWQVWEAEYEGLKEEVQTLDDLQDPNALLSLSKSYHGDLVNEKEIRDIAALDKDSPRTVTDILGVVGRRQEYVRKNIETTQRRYWDAEAKLEELDFAAVSANRDAKGLPLTEIHEELDDDDNVISSTISHPDASSAKIFDSLQKAGLSNKNFSKNSAGQPKDNMVAGIASATDASSGKLDEDASYSHDTTSGSEVKVNGPNRPPIRKKSVSFSADTKKPPEPVRTDSEDGRKSVSFAPKVAVAPAADPPDTRSVSFAPVVEEIPAAPPATVSPEVKARADVQKNLRAFFKPGDKVGELNDDDQVTQTHIVIPENESEEDARMRREMLDYHLNEVGHVVAQIDLEEGDEDGDDGDDATTASDFTSSEHPDEDTPYTSGMSDSEDEDEDDYGRTKKRVISDDYHRQMKALEHRLIGNLGQAPTDQDLTAIDSDINPQDVHKLVIREEQDSAASNVSSDGEKKSSGKKRVSFAEALDVAEPSSPPLKALKTHEGANVAPPMTEEVSKRDAPVNEGAAMDVDAPTGPPGMVISDQLLERTPKHTATAPSTEEPDAIMQRRELAAEYYRRRNEMIREQGSFKAGDADAEQFGELMEEKDGKLKKVSRFKAARLKP